MCQDQKSWKTYKKASDQRGVNEMWEKLNDVEVCMRKVLWQKSSKKEKKKSRIIGEL